MTEEIVRTDIYKMIKEAVNDGLGIVRQHEADGKLIHKYFQFPEMSHFPSGFPNFSKVYTLKKAPLDYKNVFGGKGHSPESIPSWQNFWEFAHKDDHLSRFWEIGPHYKGKLISIDFPGYEQMHSSIRVYGCIKNIMDHYIHVSGKKLMEEDLFRPIYQEWENCIFCEELKANIVIPIIGLQFAFDKLELGDNAHIERMGDLMQLARNTRSTYTVSTHDVVIGAATHSLVLRDWKIAQRTLEQRQNALTDIGAFTNVILTIDKFFAALRVEASVETGYSQLIVVPINWGDSWEAHLPHVDVVTVRAYPDHFEKYIWLRKPPMMDEHICKKIAGIFNALNNTSNNRLVLAARRLNAAVLRSNEEDSILDVTMGLETLLTSDTRTEITYKLAMRATALSTIEKFEGLTPTNVFRYCKEIYDYRSKVIHSSKKAKMKRTIKFGEDKEIPIVRLGVSILRCSIKALSHNVEYLKPEKLDRLLISSKKHMP